MTGIPYDTISTADQTDGKKRNFIIVHASDEHYRRRFIGFPHHQLGSRAEVVSNRLPGDFQRIAEEVRVAPHVADGPDAVMVVDGSTKTSWVAPSHGTVDGLGAGVPPVKVIVAAGAELSMLQVTGRTEGPSTASAMISPSVFGFSV